MHRSPLSVLVILAAMAACSTHDDSQGSAILSKDSTLVAQLQKDKQQPALPTACGAVTVAAQPAAANKRQADELTRRAYDAEMLGNVQEARALLRRATELDATNKSASYHLGLTSETLGDRTAAISAYCRYLTLTPTTAESVEARQRVAKLSQTETRMAAGSVSDSESTPVRRRAPSTTAGRVARGARTVEPRVVASTPVAQSVPAASRERDTPSPTSSDPVATSPSVDRTADGPAAGSDGASSRSAPSVEQPSTSTRTERRGASRTQSAIIGAAAGAIIGGATGRSVKGAVIGAAAGGIFGTAVGGTIRPLGRGSRS